MATLTEFEERRKDAAVRMRHAEAVYAARVAREDIRHEDFLREGADPLDEEVRYEEAITRAHARVAAARADYKNADAEYRRALNASHR